MVQKKIQPTPHRSIAFFLLYNLVGATTAVTTAVVVAMARLRAMALQWQARVEAGAWARAVAVEWQWRSIGGP